MSTLSPRVNRFLVAIAISLLLATIVASVTETSPDSAILRGDFPAFYTMAVVAREGSGGRLYDLVFQQEIQARYWPSLSASVLPVAYPAFMAMPLLPLAYLSPHIARFSWIICTLLATLGAVQMMIKSFSNLRALRWQTTVVCLGFFPLFAGVIGGQAIGVSLLLLAAITSLSVSTSMANQLAVGLLTGLWMFKPHYALAVVWLLLLQRRGWALLSWALTSVALWLIGAHVSGIDWLGHWLAFAKQFSHIDLLTNSDQMTGVVPFLFSIVKRVSGSEYYSERVWASLSMLSSALAPLALFAIHKTLSKRSPSDPRALYLLIAPVLLLLAPAANFYDLALLLISLGATISPFRVRDVRILTAIIVLSALALLSRELGFFGGSFLLSSSIGGFIFTRVLRVKPD
ncbi:MAG: hypothetical protein RL326_2061 [Pseudomonadota bacterium]|jgi:hypothetical protein